MANPARDLGEGVADLQGFLVQNLQKEVSRLTALQSDLVTSVRINQATQGKIHSAVLALFTASSLNHFLHILTQDLPELLDLDVISLCVEEGETNLPDMTGIQWLKAGHIDKANWNGGHILLRSVTKSSIAIFGPAAELVKSDALLALTIPGLRLPVMLAMGSRDEEHFQEDQATELLEFLMNIIEASFQIWLEKNTP